MLDLLEYLRPDTLVALAADLEEALEAWQAYPEDAPPEQTRQAAARLLAAVQKTGASQPDAGLDFAEQVAQLRDARDRDEDWQTGRNAQTGQNWFSDYR